MKDGSPALTGRAIKQPRGRKTYEAFVVTGFELLRDRELDSVPVAELAQAAGYSVGAFYARFHSKDQYFDALMQRHFEQRDAAQERIFASSTAANLVENLIAEMVAHFWQRRGFWRTALRRGLLDSRNWEPLRARGHNTASSVVASIARLAYRELSPVEESNVRFALLIVFAMINNSIANRPQFAGPEMGEEEFVRQLVRAFRLVAGYDAIVGSLPAASVGRAAPGAR